MTSIAIFMMGTWVGSAVAALLIFWATRIKVGPQPEEVVGGEVAMQAFDNSMSGACCPECGTVYAFLIHDQSRMVYGGCVKCGLSTKAVEICDAFEKTRGAK